jgi:lysophospholipase L1-like esterase
MEENYNRGRRSFLKKAGASGAVALSIPQIVSAAYGDVQTGKIVLAKDDVILFQGDSITDAGRNRDEKTANNAQALGRGYAFVAGSKILHDHAGKNIQVWNKGISGNKVFQLAERWDEDCLAIKPTVLSILIGVNDYWHTLTGKYTGTVEIYRNDLIALLERTKKELPGIKLIIGEPFAVPGIKAVDDKWFPAFYEYQKAAREVATRFNATFVPYQRVFDKAAKSAPGVYWTHDGVHATVAGNQLMAQAWLEALA